MWNIESTIKPRAAALKISLANLAILVGPGCSKAGLSEASNGGNLNREVALRVDARLKELETFAQSVAPVRVDLSDARLVEQWLADFNEKRTKAAAPAAAPDALDLLREIAINGDDLDSVLTKRNCSAQQLLEQLSNARAQLTELTQKLAARNADREQLNTELRKQTTL